MLARAHKFIVGLLITATKIGNQFSKFLRNYSTSSPTCEPYIFHALSLRLRPASTRDNKHGIGPEQN